VLFVFYYFLDDVVLLPRMRIHAAARYGCASLKLARLVLWLHLQSVVIVLQGLPLLTLAKRLLTRWDGIVSKDGILVKADLRLGFRTGYVCILSPT
jgi:hypothetical protein